MVFPLKYQLPILLIGGGVFGVVNLFNDENSLEKIVDAIITIIILDFL